MESNDEAIAHVLESFGISELEMKQKMILDFLREFKDWILFGITCGHVC